MPIFFPDNDKRRARLVELSADAQGFLTEAKTTYKQFLALNTQVNARIAAVYQKAGLARPSVSPIDILRAQKSVYDIATADTIVEVSNIVLGIGGLAATMIYFAPAATSWLVEAGVLEAETASAVLFSALGTEATVGALAGGIAGGLVTGAVVLGIGLAIDAIEGGLLRDELRAGIRDTDPIRASTRYSLDKSRTAMELLQSVQTTCDTLLHSSIPLTDEIIQTLIEKDAVPALRNIESITRATVIAELRSLDDSRHSWTNEDAKSNEIVLPRTQPIYVRAATDVPESMCPTIPEGLKLTALQHPDPLHSKSAYPILRIEDVQYWPFSYRDNRNGMAIVAFDSRGRILKRWDKLGARYIHRIEEDLAANHVVFVGQSGDEITMKWSELTDLHFDASVRVPWHLCGAIPHGLKLTALQRPDALESSKTYPVLMVGSMQFWPLSYLDNRIGMAILAFDGKGHLRKRWDKTGARYIWRIEESLQSRDIAFIGQEGNRIRMTLSELTAF